MESPPKGTPRAATSILESVQKVEKLPMFAASSGNAPSSGKRRALLLQPHKPRGPAAVPDGPVRSKLFGVWQAAATDVETAHLAMSSGVEPGSMMSVKTVSGAPGSHSSTRDALAPDALNAEKRLRHGVELSFSQAGHRQSWQTRMQDGVRYTEYFKQCCKRKYFNMTRAWRVLLDPGGNGRVSFVPFCRAARAMGFANVLVLWKHLDMHNSGFITLDCWDADAFRNLMEFRHICNTEYGGVAEAFRWGIDKNGSGTISKDELKTYLDTWDFSGNIDILWGALDENIGGFLTVDELDFLTRWEGERFRPARVAREYNLGFVRLQMIRRKQKMANQKIFEDRQRGEAEKQSIEHSRMERRKVLRQSETIAEDTKLQALESYKAPTKSPSKEGDSDDDDVTYEKRCRKRLSIQARMSSQLGMSAQLELQKLGQIQSARQPSASSSARSSSASSSATQAGRPHSARAYTCPDLGEVLQDSEP